MSFIIFLELFSNCELLRFIKIFEDEKLCVILLYWLGESKRKKNSSSCYIPFRNFNKPNSFQVVEIFQKVPPPLLLLLQAISYTIVCMEAKLS